MATVAEVEAALVRLVLASSRARLALESVNPLAPIVDSGYLDSLTVVEFLARVERELGVRLPESKVHSRRGTIRALAELIGHG